MEDHREMILLLRKLQGNASDSLPPQKPMTPSSTKTRLKALLRWSAVNVSYAWSSLIDSVSSLYTIWAINWWTLELLSWVSAASALGAMILVLSLHQNKPLPQRPLSVTLNSLLSILSQIAQWGLMGSVTKAIGQSKWLWFVGPKRYLKDFVTFDDASRGPWGSFVLLIKGKLMYSPLFLQYGV